MQANIVFVRRKYSFRGFEKLPNIICFAYRSQEFDSIFIKFRNQLVIFIYYLHVNFEEVEVILCMGTLNLLIQC